MPAASGRARVVGRYALYEEIASGGMASVHFGRLLGPVGFVRTVAIKRLHPHYAKDPEFVAMFLDEARLAARIRHPNVVPTLDVVAEAGELFLVMDYVEGESLARLSRAMKARGERVPHDIVLAIVCGVLHGLHAAHEARDESGAPLDIVHRDVSPQNVLVGVDGVARVLDFGIAKAAGRAQTTRDGQIKGKVSYMPPEQIQGAVTRRTDVYAVAVVLWETLVGRRLFEGDSPVETLSAVINAAVPKPSALDARVPTSIDEVVLRGLSRDPRNRFPTARDMAHALEACLRPASMGEVAEWVREVAKESLRHRADVVANIESESVSGGAAAKSAIEPRPALLADFEPQHTSREIPVAKGSSRRSSGVIAVTIALVSVIAFLLFLLRTGATSDVAARRPAANESREIPSSQHASTAQPLASSASPQTSITSAQASIAGAPAAKPKPKGVSVPAPSKKSSCDPPWSYDAKGKKVYKEWCL